jgi:hypothetical protein
LGILGVFGFGMENVGIFFAIWRTLQPFGIGNFKVIPTISSAGLPYQKYHFWSGFGMESVGIFYGHLVNFAAIW